MGGVGVLFTLGIGIGRELGGDGGWWAMDGEWNVDIHHSYTYIIINKNTYITSHTKEQ